MKKKLSLSSNTLFESIRSLIQEAQQRVVRNINTTMLIAYFEIGKRIVEHEQHGKQRADYAKQIITQLSKDLTREFGRGYSVDNLERFRKFYLIYKNRISASLVRKSSKNQKLKPEITKSASVMRLSLSNQTDIPFTLSWTHYIQLLKIDNEEERNFYEIEATQNYWSVRELQRQYHSALYERLVLSRDKKGVKQLAQKGQIIEQPTDALKNPYVLEFLDLREDNRYTENDMETAIINKLEHFMLELGKGFCFVGRQKRFTFEGDSFYVDLVFYNRLLKCFVLFDLLCCAQHNKSYVA